jgi:hypothetical protein
LGNARIFKTSEFTSFNLNILKADPSGYRAEITYKLDGITSTVSSIIRRYQADAVYDVFELIAEELNENNL